MKKARKKSGSLKKAVKFLLAIVIIAFIGVMIMGDDGDYSIEDGNPDAKSDAAWTLMVYMCGSDLESGGGASSDNLKEMMNADFSDKVNVIVETGGSSYWYLDGIDPDSLAYYHVDSKKLVMEKTLDSASMGDPDTLADFITWGRQNYPAEKYGLIMWDHGGGSLQGLCWDENHDDDNLTLPELNKALVQADTQFEMIGMDACLMASLETAEAIDEYGKYMVASQEYEPGGGWDYKAFLDYLGQNSEADGEKLGEEICNTYFDKCRRDDLHDMATLSVVDLSRISSLSTAFQAMSEKMLLLTRDAVSFRALCQGTDVTENYGGNNKAEGYTDMVDLRGLTENTESVLPDTAERVLDLQEKAVRYQVHGSSRAGAKGLSAVYPLLIDDDIARMYEEISDNRSYLQYMNVLNDSWDESMWDEEDERSIGLQELDPIQADDYDVQLSQEIDENSTLHVYVTSGLESVEQADFSLLYLEPDSGDFVFLGTDSDLDADWEQGEFTDRFGGTWITIGGQYVNANLIEQGDDYNVYTIPAIVNGNETNIRATYDMNDEEFTVNGTYDGIDEETGSSGRNIRPLKKGDKVVFVLPALDENLDDTDDYQSEEIVWSDDIRMEDEDLMDGTYIYIMPVYDYFGEEYDADPITMTIEDGWITAEEIE